ncbi:DUF3427 domain-containing protein [Virgibacillus ihumii]|uniref:DUF3427 domain-containing protein n=1 Tax=Virgibacillus ihumii TaxID=2686091 RepID=UPI0024841AF4|nr:DUF3427 domain-containing protein [Virgibacillus ihumii]
MHSGGSGLLANGDDYFLYIDLHKEADIKESINYNDKIVDRNHFQWETPKVKLKLLQNVHQEFYSIEW